ncbi:DMT family transporter [Salicibibacter cibarius]|uniref:DMT family transporter n=1 Tax=Salicibibacter cibarius TaxID=2743000 RepID=A0A7T6Z4F7_9BACI|nr:DMT family transporter [Salicibibacter cibarius]QQK76815.1 DMT family transporter [Salicibibacter cibarius]
MTVLIPLIGGIFVSLQGTLNGNLGKKVGTIESTYLSFFTGSILLTMIIIFLGDGNIFRITEVPAWQLLCVIFGFIFIFVMAFSVPKIGVTATNATIVIGQLVTSMVVDHFGWFGSDVIPFTIERFIGVLLMIAALYFIYMESAMVKKKTKQMMKKEKLQKLSND